MVSKTLKLHIPGPIILRAHLLFLMMYFRAHAVYCIMHSNVCQGPWGIYVPHTGRDIYPLMDFRVLYIYPLMDSRAQYYDWSDATSRTLNLAAINFTDIFVR
jgi:hypothetical protein